tara:strand:- start:4 stop:195 length:192 start_codon:yes stop_codon:yes gene_type:complete
MSKFKVEKSLLENAGFWSLYTGTDLTTEKLYKTRDEAVKAGIDNQFLNDHLEIIEIYKHQGEK